MEGYRFHHHPLYDRLAAHALSMNGEDRHLKTLIRANNRMADFSATGGGIFFDYSRQRVDATTMALLDELADAACVKDRFADMANGKKVNVTENRAALHMAARSFSAVPIYVDGRDIKADLETVRRQIQQFSGSVHRGEIIGSTGQPLRHVVVVGIGGSYLGTQFVANALEAFADKGVSLEFLANVDIHNFGRIWSRIQPEQTLWVIISKSYTTAETMANEDLIRRHMNGSGLDPSRHLITVTSKGSPGTGVTGGVWLHFTCSILSVGGTVSPLRSAVCH
jgi:glucose-6-phosphate isomerase